MAKSADAFRTISEVADILQVPAHVLRFWESKFSQVKPVKRAGGRRYYRPDDIRLLSGIRMLLHDDGMTIKGVQKILRERGTAHVADMAPALSELQSGMPDTAGLETTGAEVGAEVLSFDRRSGAGTDADPPPPDTEDAGPGSPEAAPPAPPPAPPDAPQHAAGPDPAPPSQAPPGPMADPDAPAPEPAPEPEPEVGDPAAPPLPPLPDLPDDPGDTDPAPPGALSALAGLRGPVPADLATRLSAIAARLHGLDAQRPANEAPGKASNTATGD